MKRGDSSFPPPRDRIRRTCIWTVLCLHFRRRSEGSVADTQISAYISETTKEQVERYAEAHGVKKGFLVEEALLHHLQALRELPADIVIPPRITVSAKSFAMVSAIVKKPRKPTKALRTLMAGR